MPTTSTKNSSNLLTPIYVPTPSHSKRKLEAEKKKVEARTKGQLRALERF